MLLVDYVSAMSFFLVIMVDGSKYVNIVRENQNSKGEKHLSDEEVIGQMTCVFLFPSFPSFFADKLKYSPATSQCPHLRRPRHDLLCALPHPIHARLPPAHPSHTPHRAPHRAGGCGGRRAGIRAAFGPDVDGCGAERDVEVVSACSVRAPCVSALSLRCFCFCFLPVGLFRFLRPESLHSTYPEPHKTVPSPSRRPSNVPATNL